MRDGRDEKERAVGAYEHKSNLRVLYRKQIADMQTTTDDDRDESKGVRRGVKGMMRVRERASNMKTRLRGEGAKGKLTSRSRQHGEGRDPHRVVGRHGGDRSACHAVV